MKVKFTETRVVDDHRKGTRSEECYVEGKTYDLDETSAQHWIARGVAGGVATRAAPAEKSPKVPGAAAGLAATKPVTQS